MSNHTHNSVDKIEEIKEKIKFDRKLYDAMFEQDRQYCDKDFQQKVISMISEDVNPTVIKFFQNHALLTPGSVYRDRVAKGKTFNNIGFIEKISRELIIEYFAVYYGEPHTDVRMARRKEVRKAATQARVMLVELLSRGRIGKLFSEQWKLRR